MMPVSMSNWVSKLMRWTAANKLGPEDVRDAILSQVLGERLLDPDPATHGV